MKKWKDAVLTYSLYDALSEVGCVNLWGRWVPVEGTNNFSIGIRTLKSEMETAWIQVRIINELVLWKFVLNAPIPE